MNILKNKIIILLFFFALILNGCKYRIDNKPLSTESTIDKMEMKKDLELSIITTDKLLYNMIKSISKDRHNVEYMFKNRDTEINFEFTEDSLNNIAKKDLLIYMGAGFEPWINNFIDKLNKNKVGVINVSRGVKLLAYNKEVKYKNVVLKDNPYYLMNMDNYIIALMNIKNSIQDKDPKNRDIYQKNFSEILKKLEIYQKDLKMVINKLSDYNFIVAEDEMNYFIKYNDLKVLYSNKDVNGKSDLEPKLKNLKNLVFLYNNESVLKDNEEIIKKYNIKVINIKIYNGESDYENIIKYNTETLKKFYDAEALNK